MRHKEDEQIYSEFQLFSFIQLLGTNFGRALADSFVEKVWYKDLNAVLIRVSAIEIAIYAMLNNSLTINSIEIFFIFFNVNQIEIIIFNAKYQCY